MHPEASMSRIRYLLVAAMVAALLVPPAASAPG